MAGLSHKGGMTFDVMSKKIAGLGGPIFRHDLGAAAGAAALRELLNGFRQSRDPYGKPWEPVGRLQPLRRKQKGPMRRGKPLIKTGHLRQSAALEVLDGGFRIAMGAEYARYHQYGTRARSMRVSAARRRLRRLLGRGGIAQRQMIPMRQTGGFGLWLAPINRATRAVVRKWAKP